MKKLLIPTAILTAMGIGFSWGYVTRHRRQFPHAQIQALARAVGLAEPKSEYGKTQVKSRSPDYLKSLEALGYVDSTYDPEHEQRDVIIHDEERVFPGPRFYNDKIQRRARLIDLSGEVLHEWRHDSKFAWGMATLLDNGDVLISIKDYWLIRIDPDSKRVWRIKDRNHHDIDVFEDMLYTMSRREILRPSIHPTKPVIEDLILRYTQRGKLINTISILDVVENSPYRFLLPSVGDIEFRFLKADVQPLDVLHANHVEVMDGSLAHLGRMYERGNIITCCRNINLVLQPELPAPPQTTGERQHPDLRQRPRGQPGGGDRPGELRDHLALCREGVLQQGARRRPASTQRQHPDH
jgi:hypothetical protein